MGLIHLKAAGEVKGDFKYLAEKLLSVKFSFTEMEKYSKTARKGLFFFFYVFSLKILFELQLEWLRNWLFNFNS